MNSEEETRMKSREYWRDAVSRILGWATGLLFILAGWGIDKGPYFEFKSQESANVIRAWLLLFYSLVFGVGIVFAVVWIYKNCLDDNLDDTIVRKKYAIAYATFIASSILGIALILGAW